MIHEGATPTRPAATTGHGAARSGRSIAIALLPLMAVVFVAYLVTGVAVSVLPVHVHERLRFGAFMVGVVAGTQVAATLISRLWAGRYADVRGSKRAVLAGVELRWRSWRGLSRIDLLHSIGVAAARRTIQGPETLIVRSVSIGDQTRWFAAVDEGTERLLHWNGAHRPARSSACSRSRRSGGGDV